MWLSKIFTALLFLNAPVVLFTQDYFFSFVKKDFWDSSNIVILSFCESNTGEIWVGTNSGIYKFDGYKFAPAKMCVQGSGNNSATLFVESSVLFKDSKGRIWSGCKNGSLYVKEENDNCFQIPLDSNGKPFFPENAVTYNILEDAQGRIWCGTTTHGIIIYDPQSHSVQQFGGRSGTIPHPSISISGLYYNPNDHTIWASTSDFKLLHFYNTERFLYYTYTIPAPPSLATAEMGNFICKDAKNRLWAVVSKFWICRFDLSSKQWEILPYKNSNQFPYGQGINNMVYNEKYNSVFISVRDVGVAIYNIDTEKATLLNKNATFASNYTIDNPQTVFFSQKQDIYVGSFYQGIQIGFSPEVNTQFTSIHFLKNQKTPDKILSILQLAPDKLLIGTDNNGLFSYTPSSNTFQEIAVKNQQGTPIKVFKTLYKDKKQCVWMGHWISGMTQWNLQSNEKKTYTNSEKPPYALRTDRANPIWGFTEDLDSNFWVINLWGEVICYFNDGKKSIQYDDKHGMQGLGSSQLLDIHCDRKGNIWVASERNGFWVKWRNSSQFEQFKADRSDPDAISSNNGFFIFEDSKGQMWFGTADQGLNLYEEPTKHFRKYTTANGLLSNCNMSMTEDDMGNLWITSSSGLTCMANKDGQYTVKFKYLPSFKNKFSHLATLYAPDESKLYIGGDAGITMLETKSLEYTAQAPKVFVSSINYHEQSNHINIDSILSLLNTQKTIKTTKQNAFISLEIACSSLNNTNFNEFAYLLEGYEEEWHYLKEGAHTITYTGLPEGNYQLKVKAKTINSDWGAVSQYTIQVGARLWERAWFNYFMIFLCLFLLLGELYLSKKHREISKIKKILQIEKEALEKNNAELASKVESWSSKLLAQSAEMIRQKEILTDVKNQINNSYYSNNVTDQDANIHKLNLTLEKGLNKDEDWEKFRLYFDHINQSFTQRLTQTYPHLTHHDINLCMLIKLGMGSHEIAKIMNITLYGVQKSRFRLKKKLNLDREENLIEHILSF